MIRIDSDQSIIYIRRRFRTEHIRQFQIMGVQESFYISVSGIPAALFDQDIYCLTYELDNGRIELGVMRLSILLSRGKTAKELKYWDFYKAT